jgi:hypothetical protein
LWWLATWGHARTFPCFDRRTGEGYSFNRYAGGSSSVSRGACCRPGAVGNAWPKQGFGAKPKTLPRTGKDCE